MPRKSRSGLCRQAPGSAVPAQGLQPYLGVQETAEARSVPAEEAVAVPVARSERAVAAEGPALGSSLGVAQGKERGLWHQRYPGQDELHFSELLQKQALTVLNNPPAHPETNRHKGEKEK